MFTGLVQRIGRIVSRDDKGERLEIATGVWDPPWVPGESVAVQGACLTVTGRTAVGCVVDIGSFTRRRTTLGQLPVGTSVHLERALRLGDRLGGHMVQGHVDGRIVVQERLVDGRGLQLTFSVRRAWRAYCILRGSIVLDGVSLTIAALDHGADREETFRLTVMLVPHTVANTLLGELTVGEWVNVEFDMMAKYAENWLAPVVTTRSAVMGGT
ncbi:riboflavin synthase [Pasteuria penetrans]|uniref:riboflavin synthase n=1 Tax=Pasteuria penetrans TaxID=86005 RepID=UPI000FA54770|nr:riboflavin synthase [Pasteuria penetrans]